MIHHNILLKIYNYIQIDGETNSFENAYSEFELRFDEISNRTDPLQEGNITGVST